MRKILVAGACFIAGLAASLSASAQVYQVVPVQPAPYYSPSHGAVIYPAVPRYYDDRYHQLRQQERFDRIERERFERERDRRYEAHRREEERRRFEERRRERHMR